jgi:hypothetical protein
VRFFESIINYTNLYGIFITVRLIDWLHNYVNNKQFVLISKCLKMFISLDICMTIEKAVKLLKFHIIIELIDYCDLEHLNIIIPYIIIFP